MFLFITRRPFVCPSRDEFSWLFPTNYLSRKYISFYWINDLFNQSTVIRSLCTNIGLNTTYLMLLIIRLCCLFIYVISHDPFKQTALRLLWLYDNILHIIRAYTHPDFVPWNLAIIQIGYLVFKLCLEKKKWNILYCCSLYLKMYLILSKEF